MDPAIPGRPRDSSGVGQVGVSSEPWGRCQSLNICSEVVLSQRTPDELAESREGPVKPEQQPVCSVPQRHSYRERYTTYTVAGYHQPLSFRPVPNMLRTNDQMPVICSIILQRGRSSRTVQQWPWSYMRQMSSHTCFEFKCARSLGYYTHIKNSF